MNKAYCPDNDLNWACAEPAAAGFDPERLAAAVRFAQSHESSWPYDLERAGSVPGLTAIEKPPWNEALGPFRPRGGTNGLVIKGGRIAARWGEPARIEMTFSVAKSYLAVLAGLAIGDGLIASVDAPVANTVPGEPFANAHNESITWRHLLTQTSEWEGTLWGKPDLVDRNRQLGPNADNSRKGEHRDLEAPGTFWEYNDVRVNVLALALVYAFRRPLADVLRERVMNPIGASSGWQWHGYRNAIVELDGQRIQCVPGGTHWGGGIQISSFDHARLALLVHRGGAWRGNQVLPEGWTDELRRPSSIHDGYGFLWWLNTRQQAWPGAPEAAYAAIGAGSHIVLIDPDHDLVLVARWIDQASVPELVARIETALEA